MLRRGYAIAENMHRGQFRKSGEPYITHPLAVAQICAELGMDTTTLVAALLHDTVEDTSYTLAGAATATSAPRWRHLVDGVTKFDKVFYGKAAEAETIRKMIVAAGKDVRVLVIKLADRLHNMRTLDARSPASRARIARATHEVLVPLCDRLGIQALKRELEDVVLCHLEPGGVRAASTSTCSSRAGWDDYLDDVIARGHGRAAPQPGRRARCTARPRHYYSIWKDTVAGGHAVPHDLPRIVVIVDGAGHRLLRRARRDPRQLAAGAGPVQGLHRLAEEQPLPVAAHHRDRPGRPLGRGADPHRGDAPRRRVRHRRQLPLPARPAGLGPSRPGAEQLDLAASGCSTGSRTTADAGAVPRVAALRPRRGADPGLRRRAGRCCCRPGHPGRPGLRAERRDAATDASAATINGRLAPLSLAARRRRRGGDLHRGRRATPTSTPTRRAARAGSGSSFVKSPHAQLQISRWFAEHNEPGITIADKVRLGRAAIGLALRQHDRGLASDLPLRRLADELGYPDLETLLVAVADHTISRRTTWSSSSIALVDHRATDAGAAPPGSLCR